MNGLMSSGHSERLLLRTGGAAQYLGDRFARSKLRRPIRLLSTTILPKDSLYGRQTDGFRIS
jgi:hypothetical protein